MSWLGRYLQRNAWRGAPLWLFWLGAPSVPAATVDVEIAGYRFVPAVVRIQVGDSVRWRNREPRTSHSILLIATGQESERLFPGEDWAISFERSGSYLYRCGPHPEMQGRIDVE